MPCTPPCSPCVKGTTYACRGSATARNSSRRTARAKGGSDPRSAEAGGAAGGNARGILVSWRGRVDSNCRPPCAHGSVRDVAEITYFQTLRIQRLTAFPLKTVEPCWDRVLWAATKSGTPTSPLVSPWRGAPERPKTPELDRSRIRTVICPQANPVCAGARTARFGRCLLPRPPWSCCPPFSPARPKSTPFRSGAAPP